MAEQMHKITIWSRRSADGQTWYVRTEGDGIDSTHVSTNMLQRDAESDALQEHWDLLDAADDS